MRLFIGPKRKQYTIHTDLLCKASHYFDVAITGFADDIVEDDEGIYFDKLDANAFETFVTSSIVALCRRSKTLQPSKREHSTISPSRLTVEV